MNNRNKMKKGKREILSIAKMKELEYFTQLINENDLYVTSKHRENYLKKGRKLHNEYSINISFVDKKLEWRVSREVLEDIGDIFDLKEDKNQKLVATAMINDINIKIFKKSYKRLIRKLRDNNDQELDKFRQELFFWGKRGINDFSEVLKKHNEDDCAKLIYFQGTSEEDFKLPKELLPIYIYIFSKIEENSRVLKIFQKPEDIKKDFRLKYIEDIKVEGITDKIIDGSIELQEFLELIKVSEFSNKWSLNLLLFNELTYLFDLYLFTKIMKENKLLKFYILSKQTGETPEKRVLEDEARLYYLMFYKLGISIKGYFFYDLNSFFKLEHKQIKAYRKMAKKIELEFEKKLTDSIEEYISVPESIRKEYHIYNKLKSLSVYTEEINEIIEILESSFRVDENAKLNQEIVLSYLSVYKAMYNLYKA